MAKELDEEERARRKLLDLSQLVFPQTRERHKRLVSNLSDFDLVEGMAFNVTKHIKNLFPAATARS
ncbi:hypothetical protein ACVW1C_001008 [Bradyrhizobium sp. USDA 4011]